MVSTTRSWIIMGLCSPLSLVLGTALGTGCGGGGSDSSTSSVFTTDSDPTLTATASATATDSDSTSSGDGDGDDPSAGDGDGDDPSAGDGDGDDPSAGDGDGEGSGDGDGDDPIKFDMPLDLDLGTSTSGGDCLECGVTLDSTQSSSFLPLPGTDYLGFATLEVDQVIYALDDPGSGRVIYTADTNLLYNEITDCPLWEWLGQSGDQLPNVLSFGRYLCNGLGNNLGNYPSLTYAGDNLPPEYVNDPAALAADYDAVIYCTLAASSDAELQTIVDYVLDHGGGLYLASEYWGFINQGDLDSVNTIAVPLGTEFQATNLDWGQANGDIGFECFPPPQ